MVIEPIDWEHEELTSRQLADPTHLDPSTFHAQIGACISEAAVAVVRAVAGMGEPLTLIFNDLAIPVDLFDTEADVRRRWAREQAQEGRQESTRTRTAAEIVGEVWALEAVANDLPPEPHEVDRQAIAAAQHALLWAAGLLSPMDLPPSIYSEPLDSVNCPAGACVLCHRPGDGDAEMLQLGTSSDGVPLLICEDACLPEVMDATGDGRTLGSFLAAVVQDCIDGEAG